MTKIKPKVLIEIWCNLYYINSGLIKDGKDKKIYLHCKLVNKSDQFEKNYVIHIIYINLKLVYKFNMIWTKMNGHMHLWPVQYKLVI